MVHSGAQECTGCTQSAHFPQLFCLLSKRIICNIKMLSKPTKCTYVCTSINFWQKSFPITKMQMTLIFFPIVCTVYAYESVILEFNSTGSSKYSAQNFIFWNSVFVKTCDEQLIFCCSYIKISPFLSECEQTSDKIRG